MSMRPVVGKSYIFPVTGETRLVVSVTSTHIAWKKPNGDKVHKASFLSWAHWMQKCQAKPGKPVLKKKVKRKHRPKPLKLLVCPDCGWSQSTKNPCPEKCPSCGSRHPIFDDIPF